ncbi:DUF1684 domain-containing protein [Angustibacter sp. Root456]|uniref:DUF1684 domain-containing protein n=1 Tax=Angustibacter sp. Root456 TaxID=1736539 RepID=UPI0006FFA562|nr:DUF1684 domain-containing protein [Angustibacter sp. Root456]KQX66253.1 hypothetical protein ASD06_07785 [Angustibacter sp. Root456]
MTSSRDSAATALAVTDWRRRVHDLYREVREAGDPAEAHTRWVRGRDELFATHLATPLLPEHRADFAGLVVTDYDPRYRFEASIEPADAGPDAFTATTGTDGEVPYERLGRVRLQAPDGEVSLDVWRLASYGGGLFVPVRDATCGRSAYGGGRYVLDTVKGADLGAGAGEGTVVIDLNFAFNPSCAYDPAWACPLAPAGNTTAVPLPVGEQHRGPWVQA